MFGQDFRLEVLKIAGRYILVHYLDFGARFEARVLKIAGKDIGARFEAGGAQNCRKVYARAIIVTLGLGRPVI